MRLAVLVPFHQTPDDVGWQRARVWEYLKARWIGLGVNLVVGADPLAASTGRFSVSRAINNAVERCPKDIDAFALYGADHIPDLATLEWAIDTLQRQPWTPLHRNVFYTTPEATDQLLAGEVEDHAMPWERLDTLCPGVLALRRGAFEFIGGMDEWFTGYGWEDDALVATLRTVFPIPPPGNLRPLFELYHLGDHRDLSPANPNRQRFEAEYVPVIGDVEGILRVSNAWRVTPDTLAG